MNDLTTFRPFTVGFDRLFDDFDRVFGTRMSSVDFPKHNVITDKNKENYTITLAVAGYGKDDLAVEVNDNVLTVRGKLSSKLEDNENAIVLHKGISESAFVKQWTLHDHMEVAGSELRDGLLHVYMKRHIPEEKKPKQIPIMMSDMPQLSSK